MLYDLERLKSYVRFYLTVVHQIDAAWDNLASAHAAVKDALAPFGPTFERVDAPTLAAALAPAPTPGDALAELFRPVDPEGLTGLTDVYEVVGRFSFQGEDDENLRRVQALVALARNEIMAQRGRLADLSRLPEQARATAARLRAEEEARERALSESKTATFEPLAQQVSARAEQTIAAIGAVPFPDFASAETAAEEYKRYAGKLDQVYQTCLPFLRKAIQNLYSFVSCEPGASWPDALPLVREMPPELITVPPADSVELSKARKSLEDLTAEEKDLARARDEMAIRIARLDGEIAAAQVKDKEFEIERKTAEKVVELVSLMEQADAARGLLPVLGHQMAERVHAAGEVAQRYRKLEAQIKLLDADLSARAEEITKLSDELTEKKGDEPVLFGKDAWRTRVADLEVQIEERKVTSGKRLAMLNQLKIELSAISVQVQTEETQRGLVERQTADTEAKLAALEKLIRELGAALSIAKPTGRVTLAEAERALEMLQKERTAHGQALSGLVAELRKRKEETLRILVREKQIVVERQHVQAMVESAEVAATEGREEALRKLAIERRAAVERHVSEVLGSLSKSLGQVSLTFIEPARKAMLKSVESQTDLPAAVLEGASAVGPVVEKLATEQGARLLAEDAALGQIQREFCDVATEACRVAWG